MLELIQFLVGSKAFHSRIQKQLLAFKSRFLPILSMKSHFQKFCGPKKWLKARDSRILVSRQFDYSKNPKIIYKVEEHLNLYGKLGVTIGSSFNSSINGFDETQRCESLRLSHGRWIGDGPLRSCHVGCEEKTHQTPSIWSWSNAPDAFLLVLVSLVITPLMDGWD